MHMHMQHTMIDGQAEHSKSAESGKRLWAVSLALLKPHFEAVDGGKALFDSLA